ncbi:MAG: Holliday junction resolvase RuvX [Thermotogae bacterium]|nr:Holliday junction resolvase RuvX [Thermotogota bacterium]
MRVLAIDYGKRRVGLAISDPERRFAFPLETVDTRRKDLKERLAEIYSERPFSTVVIGKPPRDELIPEVEALGRWIGETFGCEVVFWDEHYTSAEAEEMLKAMGKRINRKNKHLIDTLAAYLILMEYLGIR